MKRDVDVITRQSRQSRHAERTMLLLRHCRTLGGAENRVPARVRLDRALGPELARRLVTSLTAHSRR